MSFPLVTIPTTVLGYNYDIQISHWNDGLTAYQRYANGTLVPLEGGIGIGLNFIEDCIEKEQWLSSIPKLLLTNSSLFPDHQFQMLWLASNSINAKDILAIRPVILAMICERYPIDNDKALRLVELGQRQIMVHLGFASTKSALKFIDKLDLTYERTSEIFHVMKLLDVRTSHFKRFSHYSRINFPCLSLDNTHPFLTGTHLGRSVAETRNTTRLKVTLCIQDTLLLGLTLGVQDPMSLIINLKTYQALIDLHDDWVERRNALRLKEMIPVDAEIPYPIHLQNVECVERIIDYYDLCKEGEEMHHCISVYHDSISRGRYVAFRLSNPERMTIGLKVVPNKIFPYEIDQISGLRNKIPSEETRKFVFDWLKGEQDKAKEIRINGY